MMRILFLSLLLGLVLPPALAADESPSRTGGTRRPNILLIITDDQGYGDLSIQGNPTLRTPHIDRIGLEGARFTRFYSQPVCAPTRACLLTGRYNYRGGVVDTYAGRAMLRPDEVTLAETLRSSNYRTAAIGKWHLGDCTPVRPQDQGFELAFVHRGGGLSQPSDAPGGRSYFNPIVFHNGRPERAQGYCTDAFTDSTLAFLRDASRSADTPFFLYLAYNAPHVPLQVPGADLARFRHLGLDETTARVYAMITNIDRNIGRLLDALASLHLERDTIVLFLTDNGPQQKRWNADLRGLKGSVYEGGIRVPALIRWPGHIAPETSITSPAGMIDLAPTLLAAAGVALPPHAQTLDGLNLLPQLLEARSGTEQAGSPPPTDRTLFAQWHRGDAPVSGRAAAAITARYKVVQPVWPDQGPPQWELYDLETDPGETTNLAAAKPEVLEELKAKYEGWFADVSKSGQSYKPVRIQVGLDAEPETELTRQDWRGPRASNQQDPLGAWEIQLMKAGPYDVTARYSPAPSVRSLTLRLGTLTWDRTLPAGSDSIRFERLNLPAGSAALEAVITEGARTYGPEGVAIVGSDLRLEH